MSDHRSTVSEIDAAFGRGDLPAILDRLADDVAWDQGIRDTGLPYLRAGSGKDHVVEFFTALAEHVQFRVFEPGPLCSGDDTVMVAVREAGTNLRTGAEIPDDLAVHIWTFGAEGKVATFRHVGDFHSHETAAAAVPTATA